MAEGATVPPKSLGPEGSVDGGPPVHPAVGVAEVLGVPLLPPSVVVGAGNRLRAALARLHRATAPPPARILESALGMLDLAALSALCRLQIPDRLDGRLSCEVLATELGVDAARLERLLRYAATRGWLRIDRRGLVRPTRVTGFLRRDHPGGWRAWVEFASGDEVRGAAGALEGGLAVGGDAFADANGASFFTWMRDRPARHAVFDGAMAAGGQMHGLLLARVIDWSGHRQVCDVGGGDGALLDVLLAEHEQLEGAVFELPDVASRIRQRPRLSAIGGDAFAAIPAGFHDYLLVNVLHDWDDEAVVAAAAQVAIALRVPIDMVGDTRAPVGRLIVIESTARGRPRDDLAIRADLLMLALTPGGRERSVAEIAALGARVGLRQRQVRRLASGDVAIVLVAEPGGASLSP
jgi:hypothetical protein